MNYIEHDFNGRTHQLSLTVGALYKIYDKFGYTDDISGTLKLDENSEESWNNTCWLYALLASQGELQRRAVGHEARPMLPMEEMRHFAAPADLPSIKTAIYSAIQLGFTRSVERSEEEEVDLILKELELQEKKTAVGGAIGLLTSLFAAASCESASGMRFSSPPENPMT